MRGLRASVLGAFAAMTVAWHPHLAAAQRLEGTPVPLRGHTGPVNALALAPTGDLLASGGQDKKVILWGLSDIPMRKALEGHTDPALCLQFSPDGKFLAAGSSEGPRKGPTKRAVVWIWNVATERLEGKLDCGKGAVLSLAYSDDGAWLATGGSDGSIRIWDVARRRELATAKGRGRATFELRFDWRRPGPGLSLVSRGLDGYEVTWRPDKLEPIKRVSMFATDGGRRPLFTLDTNDLSYSESYLRIAISMFGEDGIPNLSQDRLSYDVCGPHAAPITCYARMSREQERIATGCGNGSILVWDRDLLVARRKQAEERAQRQAADQKKRRDGEEKDGK